MLSSLHWEDHPSSTLADHQVTKYGSQSSGSTSAPRRTYYDPSAFPQSKPTQRLSLVDGKFTSLITDSKLDKGAFQLTVSLDSLAEAKGVAEIPDLTRSCFFFFGCGLFRGFSKLAYLPFGESKGDARVLLCFCFLSPF